MFTKKSKTAFLFFSFIFSYSFGQLKVLGNGYTGAGTASPSSQLHVSTYWGNQLRLVSTRGGLSNQSGIDFCTYNGTGIVARVAAEDQGSFRGNINFYCNGEGIAHSTTLRKIFHVDYLGNAYLYGNFYAQQTWMWSDRKLKENIVTCNKAIEMINALRGVTYDTKDSIDIIDNTYYLSKLDSNKAENSTLKSKINEKTVKIAYGKNFNFKKQYGLIAQEVETVLPEAVMLNKVGIKTVNYNAIIPVLVEAIKEQNAKIENMEARLRKLEKPKAGARTDDTKSSTEKTSSIAYLYQNSPNPFSQETTIKYSLPETVQDAFISITDLNGKQLKTLPITTKGESSVALKANELYAGLFVYTLVADGNIVDSKRMVIVE